MSEPQPPSAPQPAAAGAAASSAPNPAYKAAAERNPALRMLGLPRLPKKLPSRNWLIFISLTTAFSAAIIYDKREKNRATARWARAVSHLAKEPLPNPSQMPRRLTIFLESPPGDGKRVIDDHFIEYVKPVLAASGLDWEFVQGRQQGDVRAALAEKIRRVRRRQERPDEEVLPTEENVLEAIRVRNHVPAWEGMRGDVVIGRHTWKEYIRGLHEGWLGPLDLPKGEEAELVPDVSSQNSGSSAEAKDEEAKKKEEEEKKKRERPPQIPAYNSTADYPSSSLPLMIPAEFSPSIPIQFPHVLGFSTTFTRLGRFLNRRKLADDIGRDVAAVCFAAAREWRENPGGDIDAQAYEQEGALAWEEKDWVKAVWKEEEPPKKKEEDVQKDGEATALSKKPEPPKERLWASPVVLDPRIAMRMRRFEISPEEEARARAIVVPEEEVEGWIKGSLRSLIRWGVESWKGEPKRPVYTDDE